MADSKAPATTSSHLTQAFVPAADPSSSATPSDLESDLPESPLRLPPAVVLSFGRQACRAPHTNSATGGLFSL